MNEKSVGQHLMSGQRIGSWTVLDDVQYTAAGERKWLCRCECGTERYVLERSLRYGGSSSCGCVNRAKARQVVERDLLGKQFSDLKVLRKAEKRGRNGGTWWVCQCSCGKTVECPGTLLTTGRKTHCGCKAVKHYAYRDIRGKRVEHITALYPLEKCGKKGGVIWHCRCDCGKEFDISYNELIYSHVKSCGCMRREHEQHLGEYLTHVDGTSLDLIRSKKIPANNTTGAKGVYYIKGRYHAKIVFEKKAYYLGVFDDFEEAARVRHEAEEELFGTVLAHYDRWKSRAKEDPAWAAENPVHFCVAQDAQKRLKVTCLPIMT